MKIRLQMMVIGASLLVTTGLFAQNVPIEQVKPNPAEMLQLPKYCWGTFGDASFAGQPSYNIPGACGPRMNHFCPALLAINRASEVSRNRAQRKKLANYGTLEVGYTLTAIPATCPILPDVKIAETRAKFLVSMLK